MHLDRAGGDLMEGVRTGEGGEADQDRRVGGTHRHSLGGGSSG